METFAHQKYMLIDRSTVESTQILRVGSLNQTALRGRLLKAAGADVTAPPLEGRGFSNFPLLQLQYLFYNTFKLTPPADYAELLQGCLNHADALPLDDTDERELQKAVDKLTSTDTAKAGEMVAGFDPLTRAAGKLQAAKPPKEKKVRVMTALGEVKRPPSSTTTGMVWDIADEYLAVVVKDGLGEVALRNMVKVRCEKEGFNASTVSTQYGKWKKSKQV